MSAADNYLVGHIRSAHYAPGDRLPSVRTLAAEAGMSPVSILRALRRLSTHGVVSIRPRIGTVLLCLPDSGLDTELSRPQPVHRARWRRVADTIRDDIAAGRHHPGRPLPGTRELAARSGVCYRTLRKALQYLADDHVLTVDHKRYYPATGRHGTTNTIVLLTRLDRSMGLEHMPERDQMLLRLLEEVCSMNGLRLEIAPFDITGTQTRPRDPNQIYGRRGLPHALGFIIWTVAMQHCDITHVALQLATNTTRVAILDADGYHDLAPLYRFGRRIAVFSMAISSRCGRLVGQHVLSQGHHSIAFVTANREAVHARRRLEGVMDACGPRKDVHVRVVDIGFRDAEQPLRVRTEDLLPDDRPVRVPRGLLRTAVQAHVGRIWTTLYGLSLLEHAADRLDPLLTDATVTAWVASDDPTAVACLDFLASRAVRVPERLSVVGFDDSAAATFRGLDSYNFNYHAVTSAMVGFVAGSPALGAGTHHGPREIDGAVVQRGSVRRLQ